MSPTSNTATSYHFILHLGLLFIITTSLASHSAKAREERDLYSSKDDVLRLNSKTFKSALYHDNKDVTFLVQFYNTFCGHCQMFSPIYKELAARVRNWTSVVRVAGIDCSKSENIAVCSESKIDGYPTLYLYPPNAEPSDVPLNLRSLNIEWNVDDLEETIIGYVGNLTTSNRHHPRAVEAMQPVRENDISAVKRLYPTPADTTQDAVNEHKSTQDLMFIIESDESYLGRKLIIEYFRLSSKLELRRILLSNKPILKTMLSRDEYLKLDNSQPLLVKLDGHDSGSRAQILVRGEAKHILPTLDENERLDFIHNRFKSFFEQFYYEELKEIGGRQNQDQNHSSKKPAVLDVNSGRLNNRDLEIHYLVHSDPMSSGKVFAVDLLKGISYLITHEVRIKGDLSPAEFATIRNVLTILSKYLPLSDWDQTMSKFISDLRTRLDENRIDYEKNGITAQQMSDLLEFSGSEAVKSRYDREHWVSCSESDRHNKGYPCSLWLLFHSLTVGEFTKAAPVRTKPTLALTTMRDYITKFFGCTVCSSNFQKETNNLESSLTQRNSSVLWLWKTHNYVNQRLNNERPSDQRKPLIDIIYPKHSRCPECYKTDVKLIGIDGKTLDDVDWSMEDVLKHLVNTFGADKIVSPMKMASLLASLKGKVNYDLIQSDLANEHPSNDMNRSSVEQWNLQSIFSASDMSICLLLYLCCIIMVALVCNAMNFKFRPTNSKSK